MFRDELENINFFISKDEKEIHPTSGPFIMGLDLELITRDLSKNGMMSLAFSVLNWHRTEVIRFSCNLVVEEKDYDKLTYQFWHDPKNQKALANATKNPVSPKAVMKYFMHALDAAEKLKPAILLVSDNPAGDATWINVYIQRYVPAEKRRTLSFTADGNYRRIHDLNSALKILLKLKGITSDRKLAESLGMENRWNNDHTALNDARTHADRWIQAEMQAAAFRESISQLKHENEFLKQELEKIKPRTVEINNSFYNVGQPKLRV